MKKISYIIICCFILTGIAFGENLTVSKLLEQKYKILIEDLTKNTRGSIKIFTLKKKNKIIICSVVIDKKGRIGRTLCKKP